jgi:hypothetical protein
MRACQIVAALFAIMLLAACSKSSGGTGTSSAAAASTPTVVAGTAAVAATAPAGAADTPTPTLATPSLAPPSQPIPSLPVPSQPIPSPIPSLSTPPTSSLVTSFTLYNYGSSAVSGQPVTLDVPLAGGDVAGGSKIQVRANDGMTILATQEDSCSKWSQDGSRASCAVSFIEPDVIIPGATATYKIFTVPESPSTAPSLSPGDITAHTNIVLKTNSGGLIPNGGKGVLEAGTWDLISINYVLANCQQYSGTTGYGANPKCGWDIVASGPNRYGIHAFQYAMRESDNAVHNWIRTDMWVDFWGNSASPCNTGCSVSFYVSEPNTFGPVGTVGGATETAYVFGAQLMNGSNIISTNLGGPSDARVTSVTFDQTTGNVSFPSSGWTTLAAGDFPVIFSSTGALPAGISAGTPYFFYSYGQNPFSLANRVFRIYDMQCAAVSNCPHSTPAAINFSDNGSGTIKAVPLTIISAFAGWMGADTSGQRYWIGSGGTAMSAPPLQVGHDFTYLSQKSKATPPYIASLAGTMLPTANEGAAMPYYPDSFYQPMAVDTTGDDPNDERIGYINRHGVISLMNPNDAVAYQDTMVIAAAWQRMHMYHINETTGLPIVMNNGPDKAGGRYATLGADYPDERMYPYNVAPFMTPSNADENWEPISESYGVWMEPSHMPLPQQVPFLKTGLPEWRFGMVMQANATVSQQMIAHQAVNGTTYYRILDPVIACSAGDCTGGFQDNQTRGIAWGFRALDQAYHFEPDDSAVKLYLHDILADNVNFNDDVANNQMTAAEQSLGYLWNDTHTGGNGIYQWWQEDFLFQSLAVNAWRGEFPHSGSFLTNYFSKQIIGRMDAGSSVGGGGCLWTGPARQINPFPIARPYILAALPTTWNGLQLNTTAQNADTPDWNGPPWGGCAIQTGGFIKDYAGTAGQTPNGLISIMAASAAFGAILNIPHAASLYASIRNMQYGRLCQTCTSALSFSAYGDSRGTISSPVFAFGPLGVSN